MMLPGSALQVRKSAHFEEINRIYIALMADAWLEMREKVVAERNALPRQQQLTRYAHPTYKYLPMKNEV